MSPEAITASYERAFRSLLWRVRPRQLQRGVELLIRRGTCDRANRHSLQESLQNTYSRVRAQTIRYLVRRRESSRASAKSSAANSRSAVQTQSVLDAGIVRQPSAEGPDFHCDSGLGGLARWLRAAGYDARFWPYIDDSHLIQETMSRSAILLTTDEPLMSRSAITWGVVPALLVPLNAGKYEQFNFVTRRLTLPQKQPRCMACGGELARVEKESVRERIPPRTYPWLDEYYECRRCHKLFWPGTHWQKVAKQLAGG